MTDCLKIAAAQITPVFLDRVATTKKVVETIEKAAAGGARLVAFGEALLPAYPLWLTRTDAARFNSDVQKNLHAIYLKQSVSIAGGHLSPICKIASERKIAVILGIAERATDRGDHTIYCSCVFIDADGRIASVHRKLMPTYEERLSWGFGDGAGLVTHPVGPFTVGALNCWENWMPLARTALYAGGEDLHVAIWPGGSVLTEDITRFIARESRSFVLSVSGIIRESDIPSGVPYRDEMCAKGETIYNGGSCIAGPDGQWIIAPVTDREELIFAEIDHEHVRRERQNFDPAGHYARPDVLQITVDRRRQTAANFIDD
uniref:Nitrilase n=1 Tax=uncultured organism TaxID=155900 RepID=Q6RWL2_9ZZZZ|nr:nitrilase [uncultured organism]